VDGCAVVAYVRACGLFETLKDIMSARADTGFPSLILASASPRRASLLQEGGLDFKVIPSEAAEIHPGDLTAEEASKINAYRKARAVGKKHPDSLVLGADTLVYLDQDLFGKPQSLEHAYQMLERLQGQTHHVVTAICLMHLRARRYTISTDRTAVTFRPLDAVKIRRYLNVVNPLDKAGAYAIQEQGDLIIEKISGSYSNVVGLPMEQLQAELRRWAGAAAA
jgi:septum formation protein